MDIVMGVVNFVKEHWVDILAIIGALDVILGIIVAWTPMEWDNNVYSIFHKWVAKLGAKK